MMLPIELYYHIFTFMDGYERQITKLVCRCFSAFRYMPIISQPELAREVELFTLPDSILIICANDYQYSDIIMCFIRKHSDNIGEYTFQKIFEYGIRNNMDNILDTLMSVKPNPYVWPCISTFYQYAHRGEVSAITTLIIHHRHRVNMEQIRTVRTAYRRAVCRRQNSYPTGAAVDTAPINIGRR